VGEGRESKQEKRSDERSAAQTKGVRNSEVDKCKNYRLVVSAEKLCGEPKRRWGERSEKKGTDRREGVMSSTRSSLCIWKTRVPDRQPPWRSYVLWSTRKSCLKAEGKGEAKREKVEWNTGNWLRGASLGKRGPARRSGDCENHEKSEGNGPLIVAANLEGSGIRRAKDERSKKPVHACSEKLARTTRACIWRV